MYEEFFYGSKTVVKETARTNNLIRLQLVSYFIGPMFEFIDKQYKSNISFSLKT